jgi:hypothetical protein
VGRPSPNGGLIRRLPPVLLVLAAWWCTLPAAGAAVPEDYYGVSAQSVFSAPVSTWATQLDAIRNGGLRDVRMEGSWRAVEPDPPDDGDHDYDWSRYDPIVEALAEAGLRWYPILDNAPDWAANGDDDPTPRASEIGDFAAFAAAFAERYGRGGEFWADHDSLTPKPVNDYEIWNEENSTTFWPSQADAPERYADLYATSRQAIRALDPQARVVVGGFALVNPPNVVDEIGFLQRMLAHRPGLVGAIDGVGLHPYQATVSDTLIRIAGFRAGIDRLLGPAVPIDVTELGWSTTSVPESQRAYNLGALAVDLPQSGCNIDRLIVYSWLTRESDPNDPEDWFGIWNWGGTSKPSGVAYLNAVQAMRGLPGQQVQTGAPVVCGQVPTPTAVVKTRVLGPRLRLRLETDKRHRRLSVFARCPAGCSIRMEFLRRRAHQLRPIAHRATRFSSRRWHFHLRIPRRAGRLKLHVVASGRGGGKTTRVRWVHSPRR